MCKMSPQGMQHKINAKHGAAVHVKRMTLTL